MKRITSALALVFVVVFHRLAVAAPLQLPSYAASGANLKSDLESTGGTLTAVLIGINVIIGILGILWAGTAWVGGDGEGAKQRFKNAAIGLVVTATASGIASIMVGGK